jgi:calcium channel MID1
MPLPKLSPLQSRLAASLVACVLVLLLYLTLSSSHFAYAADVDSIRPEDHNHERLLTPYILDGELDDIEQREVGYQAEFFGFDRSIIGRAPSWVSATIPNNNPWQDNVQQGKIQYYMFANSSVWGKLSGPSQGLPPSRLRQRSGRDPEGYLEKSAADVVEAETHVLTYDGNEAGDHEIRKRQLQTRTVYITINTCLQPNDPNDPTGSKGAPGQLVLYVSQSAQSPMSEPGSTKPDNGWQMGQMVEAVAGFANITVEASGDVFIGVYAPSTDGFVNPYNVKIAASIDAPFHYYNNTQPNLYLVDSDSSSALLVTNNLTSSTNGSVFDAWMSLAPPFVIFAANQNNALFAGIQNSYCGLENYAQIASTAGASTVQTSMTNVTSGPFPKQQFYFQGLNGSSSYYGILAMNGNSTASGKDVVGGGGQVWQAMNFQTQSGIIEHLISLRRLES